MKKFILVLLSAMMIVSLCSCSDFGFNPTGHWKFVSDTLYDVDGTVIDAALADDNSVLKEIKLVFEKSGTGYIKVYEEKMDFFTYSYDNESITVTYLPNEYHDEVIVEFKPSEDGKEIKRIEYRTENGVEYREENLYKRV